MNKSPSWLYTAIVGAFLLLQGASTLAFRLYPPLDRAFPALLGITQMIPPHSLVHILTGLLALVALARGGERGAGWFAGGFGAFYTGLALFGMIARQPSMLGLQPFDHPFHFLIGGLGLLLAGQRLYRIRRGKEALL